MDEPVLTDEYLEILNELVDAGVDEDAEGEVVTNEERSVVLIEEDKSKDKGKATAA